MSLAITATSDGTYPQGSGAGPTPAATQTAALPGFPAAQEAIPGFSSGQTAAPGQAAGPLGTQKAASLSPAQVQGKLDPALQKSGMRTEIENDKSGLIIVRVVQSDTGAVVVQLPTQTTIELVAMLTKSNGEDTPALAGHLYDRSA